MRTTLAVLTLALLVPSTALADDLVPADHSADVKADAKPAQAQPPQTKPVTPAPMPRVVEASSSDAPDADGYVAPHFVPYRGGDIPKNAHIETKANLGLVGAGASIGGGVYFISLVYALSTCGAQMDCRAGSGWLYVPIVGPFITAAQSPTSGGAALAAFDGSVQVLGAVLAVAGVVAPRKFVVWQDKTAAVTITPTMPGRMGAGLALTLTHL